MTLFDHNSSDSGPNEKLLQAAFKLFAENGYNGTSTRSLCQLAEVNISAIPYYFNSKEGLYKALIQEITLHLRARVNVYLEKIHNEKNMSPEKAMQILELFINNLLDIFLDQDMPDNFGLIISREHLNPTDAYEILYNNLFKDVFSALCKLLSVLMNKKENDQDIIISVNTILGQIISFKLFRHTLLRLLQTDKIEQTQIDSIKTIVSYQIKAIINTAGGQS